MTGVTFLAKKINYTVYFPVGKPIRVIQHQRCAVI